MWQLTRLVVQAQLSHFLSDFVDNLASEWVGDNLLRMDDTTCRASSEVTRSL